MKHSIRHPNNSSRSPVITGGTVEAVSISSNAGKDRFLGTVTQRPNAEMSLSNVFAAACRHKMAVLTWMLVTLAIATVVIMNLTPRYRADALVALDTRQIRFSDVSAVVSDPGNLLDGNFVRSEVAILSSAELARRVVNDLQLYQLPEFRSGPPRLVRLIEFLGEQAAAIGGPLLPVVPQLKRWSVSFMPPSAEPDDVMATALSIYRRALSVSNDGRSYIISLSFETTNPQLASRIVNRHAEIYIDAQRQLKDQALASATRWLDREVGQLASRLKAAESAVQAYHEKFSLFSPRGVPLSQQRLLDVQSQLVVAQADLFQREARLRQSRTPDGIGSMTETVTSDAITRLRDQEVVLRRRAAELGEQLGDRNPNVAPVRAQLRDVQKMIEDERQKVARNLSAEVAVAQSRVDNLQQSIQQIEEKAASVERDEAGARSLDREASALRGLYESLLSRQKQVATQIGIQQPDAQLVSPADVPRTRSYPNTSLFLSVALLLSGSSGVGLALLLDRRRSVVRTIDELRDLSINHHIISLPRVSGRFAENEFALAEEVGTRPKSRAADALRVLRNALSVSGQGVPRSIAIMSVLPGDGKTSVALALGRTLVGSGQRVLLIDGDLWRGRLRAGNKLGLVDVLEKRCRLDQAICDDASSAVRILPGGRSKSVPGDLLATEAFGQLVTVAELEYDVVIIDTPPLDAVSDALVIARTVKAALIVVRADRTSREMVATAVQDLLQADLPITNLVLNGVEPSDLSRYVGGNKRLSQAYLEN